MCVCVCVCVWRSIRENVGFFFMRIGFVSHTFSLFLSSLRFFHFPIFFHSVSQIEIWLRLSRRRDGVGDGVCTVFRKFPRRNRAKTPNPSPFPLFWFSFRVSALPFAKKNRNEPRKTQQQTDGQPQGKKKKKKKKSKKNWYLR